MSTKTLQKRIALIAVAALGTGLLAVAPANAAMASMTATVTLTSDGATATPISVGSTVTADLKLTPDANVVADTTFTATWKILDPNGTNVTSDATFSSASIGAGVVSSSFSGATATITLDNVAAAAQKIGAVSFPAKSAGRYTIQYSTTDSTAGDNLTGAQANGNADNNPYVYVSGSGAVVASSGVGTTTITAVSGGIAQVRFGTDAHTASSVYNLTSSGVGSIQTVANGTLAPNAIVGIAGTTDWTQGAKVTTDADTTFNDVLATVASNVAGTQTLTWTKIDSTTGAPTVVSTQTITWGASPALSTGNSTVYLSAGNDAATLTADDAAFSLDATAGAGILANIQVTLLDGNALAYNGQKLTVTVDGPGLIGVDAGAINNVAAAATNRIYADASANSVNTWQIGIAPDGTAGTSKITIKVGDVVVATKSVVFYGSVAKYVATPTLIATANGVGTKDAVVVCATDANGNAVPGATVYASSADTNIAAVASTGTTITAGNAVVAALPDGVATTGSVDPTAYIAAKGAGCVGFTVTATSQTTKDSVVLTFRNASLASSATVSTTATINVGGVSAATVSLTSDKASYAAGSKGTLTLTFKDATGRLVGAGPGTGTLAAALTSSASLQGDALFATANGTTKGVATADVYFPWNAGTVLISGTTGLNTTYLDSAARGVALSKSVTVTSASSATDAAIASLIAKINALAKLIAKIQKKLGVK